MRTYFKCVVSFICIIGFLLTFSPKIALGRDYAKQLSDPKDLPGCEVDIKTMYVKDDRNSIYFKTESWKNWDLEDNRVIMFLIYINTLNTDDSKDCRYGLGVMEIDGVYVSALLDLDREEMLDIQEESGFTHGSPNCILSVRKSTIDLKSARFSFWAAVLLDTGDDLDADIAPDGDDLCHYVPGPSTGEPELNVITKTLNFGQVQAKKTTFTNIEIANDGDGILTGTITSKNPEIIPSKRNIELDEYETVEIPIELSAANLQPGDFQGSLEINTNGGNETVSVLAEILHAPELVCESEEIDFGKCFIGERKTERLRIRNRYSGPIKGSIKSKAKWAVVSKDEFEENINTISVTLSSKSLDAGPHETEIVITSEGGNQTIPVKVEIVPLFETDVDKLDFGSIILEDIGDIPPQKVLIKNNSDEEQTLKIEAEEDWIKINTSTFIIGSESEKELSVSINSKSITSPGYMTSFVTLSNKNASIEIPVTVNVKSNPPILVWIKENAEQKEISGEITIGKNYEVTLTLKNEGYGVCQLKAFLEQKESPIRLFVKTNTLKRDETTDITLKLDSSKITEPGKVSNTLIIESNGGNLSIPIQIQVKPKKEVVIVLTIGFMYAYINDEPMKLDAPPYIKKGSTMVPLRFISEAMKAEVTWENIGKGRILIEMKELIIQLDIGSNSAWINGKLITLTAAPEIVQSRTFVPLRFISEAMEAQIEWESSAQKITIRFFEEE